MSLQRRLPPIPDHIRDAAPIRDEFDLNAFGRGALAPLATRLRTHRAWSKARGALRLHDTMQTMNDASLTALWQDLSHDARAGRGETTRRLASLREITRRVTGLLPHPVQLVAATALSNRTGVEMATGEGKTLVTIMAAALQASEGWPVHVITANDYLALRDLEEGRALFDRLGLTCGGIDPEAPPPARREVYAGDIVYASSKEIAFDHLKDRIAFGDATGLTLKLDAALGRREAPVMRGLWSAIVDEADSVLIDEARTPLVISAAGGSQELAEVAGQAVRLARRLSEGRDYTLDPQGARPVELTESGAAEAFARAVDLGGIWSGQRRTRELTERALYALHILNRDVHYILREGKVEIVDENTGRVMADRTWSEGLHQMVEIKEGLPPSEERATLGRLTFQRFFRRYLRLSGLSGTLAEASRELRATYDLTVMAVPTHRPSQRRPGVTEILPDLPSKWDRVAQRAAQHREQGRPVLIGTRTVEAAEAASAALDAAGLPHRVLSARQDAEEAEIIGAAGISGTVTVATNMAGRGADIRLDEAARAAGGLAVILTERHEAGRIDRQLIGRSARQGDPGLYDTILSAEDPILGLDPPRRPTLRDYDRMQRRIEALHAASRVDLNRMEEGLNDMMAFAGGLE
jgi:preprotein translocase subunit SecA